MSKAFPGYTESSRPAWATAQDPVSNLKEKRKTGQEMSMAERLPSVQKALGSNQHQKEKQNPTEQDTRLKA